MQWLIRKIIGTKNERDLRALRVTVDEVNLGVSAGDGFSTRPYAYVGPWDFDPDVPAYGGGGFWNAPFGAVLEPPARPGPTPLTEFFRAGLERVRRGRRRGL